MLVTQCLCAHPLPLHTMPHETHIVSGQMQGQFWFMETQQQAEKRQQRLTQSYAGKGWIQTSHSQQLTSRT